MRGQEEDRHLPGPRIVLACTRYQGRLRLMSVITEPATVRRILEHLGIPATAPPILPRARDPAASVAGAPPDRLLFTILRLPFAAQFVRPDDYVGQAPWQFRTRMGARESHDR